MKRWKILVGILAAVLLLFAMLFSIYRRAVAPYVYLANSYEAVRKLVDSKAPEPRSFKAHIELTVGVKGISTYSVKADVKYLKPNRFFVATEGRLGNFTVVSDGVDVWLYLPERGVAFHGINDLPAWSIALKGSRPAEGKAGAGGSASSTKGGKASNPGAADITKLTSNYSPAMTSTFLAGERVRSITLVPRSPERPGPTLRFYIAESDLLPRMITVDYGEGKTRAELVLSDVAVSSGVSDQDFVFQPPEGTKVKKVPREQLLRSLRAIPEVIPEML